MNTPNLTQLLSSSPSTPSPSRSNAAAAPSGAGFGRVMERAVADQAPPKPAPREPQRNEAATARQPQDTPPPRGQRGDATAKAAPASRPEAPKEVGRRKADASKEASSSNGKEPQADAATAEIPVADTALDSNAINTALAGSVATSSAKPDGNATLSAAVGGNGTPATAIAVSVADPLLPSAPVASATDAAAAAATTAAAEKSTLALASPTAAIDAANATAAQDRTAASATEQDAAAPAALPADARLRLRSDAKGAALETTTATAETVAATGEGDAAPLAALAGNARLQAKSDTKGAAITAANAARAQGVNGAALAAAKPEHGAAEPAPHVAAEQHFEHLLGTKVLSASRADNAASNVPFASLLNSSAPTSGHGNVTTPVGTPGFAQDFSQRVVLLAAGQIKSAELTLTPADLGPVRVTVEMRGQEASLMFAAAASATRAAIEEAMPRLREMFAQQGLSLLNASVGAEVGQHSQSAYGRPKARRDGARGIESTAGTEAAASAAASRRPVRLIDVIA